MTDDKGEYEARLKHRISILLKYLKEGRILLPENHKQIAQSINNIRLDAAGEIDLNSVDGFVRAFSLMAENIHYREELKSYVSLNEIQRKYFEYIEGNFGFFYDEMVKNNLTPHTTAHWISNSKNEEELNYLNDNIEEFLSDVEDYWENSAEIAYVHLEDSRNCVKAVFGGDFFPSNEANIASKCGIYVDTIILPDPFIRSKNSFKKWSKKDRVYYLIKHALNILQYKSLALAETTHPIVVILPDRNHVGAAQFNQVQKLGESDALYHIGKIFDRDFSTVEELLDFCSSLNDVEKVLSNIKNIDRILFDSDYKEPIREQIIQQMTSKQNGVLQTSNPGTIIAATGLGRMTVCNELLLKSARLGGTPLIDAPTSWQYFKWKLEYDSERANPGYQHNDLHIIKGLNELSNTSLQWIGNIPPEALIELRNTGAIDEIRSLLQSSLSQIEEATKSDFNHTSQKVFETLYKAFEHHNDNIKALKEKKWKFAGKDIGSWLVMGSIQIAAACTGHPVWGLSAYALDQLINAPKLKDIPKTYKELSEENKNLKRSPIGIMFKYKP